ncbi:GDSL-type esterase/lipase family protein [Gracilimonas tropica]|uniref:GDSL-type esterase/lipase family protein n=1 Tax=Gracilimonas tropica TaxID=454600 RepID=UPI0003632BD1|nr:GDSL-type esterase/lipase family protein [Gracilimonas tropica]
MQNNILSLFLFLFLGLMAISCDQIPNEPVPEPPIQDEIEPIIQVADTLYGDLGKASILFIPDYFESKVPFTSADLYGDHLKFTALSEDSFRVVHSRDTTGNFVIHAELKNEDDFELDTELIYAISGSDSTPDEPVFEPAEITQTGSLISGKQGDSVEFSIFDYFESDAEFTSVVLYSDDISIDSLGNGNFRLSQPDDLSGDFLINVEIQNADQQKLEAALTYEIEPQPEPEPPAPSDETLVIMPLGDSMTNDSRPRVKLWNLLEADGHDLDYVGNQRQNSSIPDPDHEGVGGIKIQGIMDKAESLMKTHRPKYVALMVGTNDIAWYFDETGQEIADRWNKLIDLIYESSDPGTYILAATIPPVSSDNVGKSGMETQDRAVLVKQYNAALREHIKDRRANGDRIILADMEAALNPSQHLSGDGVHLNAEGYAIMGTVYYQAMNKALNEEN